MSNYKVISIDMFQTLVDINSRKNNIWKRILGENYTQKLATQYASSINKIVYSRFHEDVNDLIEFRNLKLIFEQYFRDVFMEHGLSYCQKEAAKIFAHEHSLADAYADTDSFFKLIHKDLPICLVSDADHNMIASHIQRFNFDKVFISEQVKAYKNNTNGKIFKEVINHYRVEPEEILHIGDSSSDIIGANRVGIKTCWLNRIGSKWKYDIKPTYTITTLIEIQSILDT